MTKGQFTGTFDGSPGVKVTWFTDDGDQDQDGVFCTLTFKVKEDAKPGATAAINITFEEEAAVFNWDEVDIPYTVVPGAITIPAAEPVEDGYYLVGTLNKWTPAAEYKFEANPENSAEYLLETSLAVSDEIKVVYVENGEIKTWYPDNADNYVVDAAHAGRKTVYFKNYYDSAWAEFGGYIWIDGELSGAEVYGSSVSLKGDIALNFFLILPEKVTKDENAYVTLNETKYPVSKATTRNVEGVGTRCSTARTRWCLCTVTATGRT